MIRKYHNHKPQTTPRENRPTIMRHQIDKPSKATSSLFPIKMIAIPERTRSNVQQVLKMDILDKQAKTPLSLEPTSFKISFSNFKPSINKYILDQWQTSWNISIGNKLLEIKPTIGEHQSVVRNIRKEEVILARLRLGHTRVTYS